MQLIRNLFGPRPSVSSAHGQGDGRMPVAPATAGSPRVPSRPLRPAGGSATSNLAQRDVQAVPASGIRARLLGWLHLSRSAEAVQARTLARQHKCLHDVTKASAHFYAQHGRVTWRTVHEDLGVVLRSWERAQAAGCTIEQVIAHIHAPELLLQPANLVRLRAHANYAQALEPIIETMRSNRAKHCEEVSRGVFAQLGLWVSPIKALAQLVALYGSYGDAVAALGQAARRQLELAYRPLQASSDMSLAQFLQIFQHTQQGQTQVAQLEGHMQQVWRRLFPVPAAAPVSPQQAAQQRARTQLRQAFEQLEFALDKRARLLPWTGFGGLAHAIAGAKKAGLDDKTIAAEFCQRPLTVTECMTLQHHLSHPYFDDEGRELVELARQLLYGSCEVRLICAERALAAAREKP